MSQREARRVPLHITVWITELLPSPPLAASLKAQPEELEGLRTELGDMLIFRFGGIL